MSNFYNDFELEQVLVKLKSAAHIENQLLANYQEETFQRTEYKSYKKKRPLLVRELYLLILQLGDLPTLQQFQDYYKSKHRIKNNNYFSEMTALKKGYLSLVRDLHFYFLLKESGLFDVVKISYLFDLKGKTDILLSKGQKRLGLQLFSGGKNMKAIKQEKNKKAVGQNNFELIYFGTKYKGNRKILNTTSGATFILYSEDDVKTVYELLENSKTIESLIDEEQCEQFDDFVESVPLVQKPAIQNSTNAKHSILEIGQLTAEDIKKREDYCLQHGITYYYYEHSVHKNIVIVDGKNFTHYEDLIDDKTQTTFNVEQYKIEHALTNVDISVMAGAGSGKTYTLVSRALFLLNMDIIEHVYEIAMITFTNEAANNILESLEKRFLQMFKNTRESRFLRYLDELREMKIMTIPAFAKFVLFEYGHQIGLGQNFNISQLITKKSEFIDAEVHNVFTAKKLQDDDFYEIEFYQIAEFVKAFSDKVEQKGVFAEKLVNHVAQDNPFEQLVVNTLAQVEKQIASYKQERDVLGLSDLTRYLRLLIENNVSMDSLGKKFKYLFVDEFQDTDILQIEFIAKLAIKSGIRLLVVGDIKQGIYRFRGADVTAFGLLEKYLKDKDRIVQNAQLNKNYRTAADVLNNLEDIFDIWKTNGHLSQSERLLPTKPNSSATVSYIECFNKVNADAIITLFNEMNCRPRQDSNEVRVLAILVRTNAKVSSIHTLLSEMCQEQDIPLQIVKDGTLFKSSAAKDLLALLYSWLYPDDKIALFELAQTAFCKPFTLPSLRVTPQYEMDNISFELPVTWHEANKQFKLAPGLIVLNEFLQSTPYDEHLFEKTRCDQTVKQYILNMHKILTLMANGVQNDQVDLYSLYKWLKIEVTTNTRDDEAELNDTDYGHDYIKVMTVHKSKGLEFDTVVLPYVKDPFVYNSARNCEIIVEVEDNEDDSNVQYSWHYKPSNDFLNITNHFRQMRQNEMPQLIQEETRNLYVALTRAKERLAIFDMADNVSNRQAQNPNTWLHLIKGGRNNAVTTCFNLCNCRSTI
ncbi:UvrD-helicase domain-containing protein [Lysinibacillus xylanilyticus]|uniref:UvrD-helicase domain-containing protein n=1 Tax=Lysinibacillus xylanilyticus TaxID=582475 RepID=UPI003D98302D